LKSKKGPVLVDRAFIFSAAKRLGNYSRRVSKNGIGGSRGLQAPENKREEEGALAPDLLVHTESPLICCLGIIAKLSSQHFSRIGIQKVPLKPGLNASYAPFFHQNSSRKQLIINDLNHTTTQKMHGFAPCNFCKSVSM
jgi:hypothetical protein